MAKTKKRTARRKNKRRRPDQWIVGAIVVSVLLIAIVLWGPARKFRHEGTTRPVQHGTTQVRKPSPEDQKQLTDRKQGPSLSEGAVPERNVRVAIVIDDLGMDLKQAREILALPASITIAVMPGLAQSKQVAALANHDKREILLHLPMEYRGKNGKPAPGMLRSDMTPMEFLNTVSDDVDSVPGAVGINNHEGSSLTENEEAMKFLMSELKARNLMFLDSYTSANSVAYTTAQEFGIKSARRDVFLDNDSNNPEAIRKQLEELVETARKNGGAIGIGHPHPATISELRKWIAGAGGEGIEIVPVSKLMH